MADPIICAMASFPPRKEGMLKVLAALLPQCDKFYLYLNQYQAVPEEIRSIPGSDKLVTVMGEDRGSQGKLFWIGQDEGYYLTVDDDMHYPSDYVARMVRGVDRYGGLAIVTVHGSLFRLRANMTPQPAGAMQNNRLLFAYDQGVPADRAVHMCGNACTACMPRKLGITNACCTGPLHSGDDADIAVWAQQHRVPIIRISTPQLWITSNHSIGIIQAWHRRPASLDMTNTKLRQVGAWRLFPLPPITPGFEDPTPQPQQPPRRPGTHLAAAGARVSPRCAVVPRGTVIPRLRSAPPIRPGHGPAPRARIGASPVPPVPAESEPSGDIVILWATARPDTFRQTHKAWMDAAVFKHKIKTYVAVDTAEQRNQLPDFNCIVTHGDRPGVCFPCYCLSKSVATGPDDIIVFASDDFFPPPQWDSFLAGHFNGAGARVLVVNDGIQTGAPVVTIPALNSAALTALNRVIYHPAYTHMWSDVELYVTANELGILRDIRGTDATVFEHRHFIRGKRVKDAVDLKVAASLDSGKRLWQARALQPARSRLAVDPAIDARVQAADMSGIAVPRISILVCTVAQRRPLLRKLLACLYPQLTNRVEVLTLTDDGAEPVGAKRNRLLAKARGDYVCFIDDDDLVADDYVARLLAATASDPDCCSLEGVMTTDGQHPVKFVHSLQYSDWRTEHEHGAPVYVRCPNHLNLVRRSLALQVRFPEISHGEDRDYSLRLRPLLTREVQVPGILYHYLYRSVKS